MYFIVLIDSEFGAMIMDMVYPSLLLAQTARDTYLIDDAEYTSLEVKCISNSKISTIERWTHPCMYDSLSLDYTYGPWEKSIC